MLMNKIFVMVLTLAAAAAAAFAQNSTLTRVDLPKSEQDRIVKAVSENEARFRQALNEYAYNRSATIQTIGLGGNITGTFRRDSFQTFTSGGERIERVLFAPVSTLTEITITPADIENLNGIDPFAIEPAKMSNYNFTFLGKEKIDDLDLYVFEVAPKVMPDWKKKNSPRYFQGRIWVDDKDLMIVKSKGKAVPEGKERFPVTETWRENVDGKFWFPSYSSADDELVFDNGVVAKVRVRVKYTNYRLGQSEVRIVDEDVDDESTPKPPPSKKP